MNTYGPWWSGVLIGVIAGLVGIATSTLWLVAAGVLIIVLLGGRRLLLGR